MGDILNAPAIIEKVIKWLAIGIAVFLAYLLIKKGIEQYKMRKVGMASNAQINKADLNPAVNYENYAALVWSNMVEPVYSTDCSIAGTCTELNKLNTSELLHVNNLFNKLYTGKNKGFLRGDCGTFRQEIEAPFCLGCWDSNKSCDDQTNIINRLITASIS